MKYKLTEKYKNGFTLIDIAKAKPCREDFLSLLEEFKDRPNYKIKWKFWLRFKTIQNNLSWLKDNGFIEKEQERWINVYWNQEDMRVWSGNMYSNCAKAKNNIFDCTDYITTVKLP